MSEKGVRKTVAVALGIVSVILAASLVGVFAFYVPMINDKNNTIVEKDLLINEKNNIIDELNGQISQLNTNVTNLQGQIDSLKLVIGLQNQVNNLTNIVNLNESMIWYDGMLTVFPPLELTMLDEDAPYAGYVSVQVSSSQSNETVVMLIYYSEVLQYRHEESINLGSGETAIFPVLPSSMAIYFAPPGGIHYSYTATVTITYYY